MPFPPAKRSDRITSVSDYKLMTKEQAELIRTEYVTGTVTLTQLAERHEVSLNALKKRSQREKWPTKRQEVLNEVAMEVTNRCKVTLADKAETFLSTMAEDVMGTMEHARHLARPNSFYDLSIRENMMNSLNKRARATFGLDQPSTPTTQIGINVTALGAGRGLEKSISVATDLQSIPNQLDDSDSEDLDPVH